MLEPAAAVTDWILTVCAVAAGTALLFDEKRSRYWVWAFFAAALSAMAGALYHTTFKESGSLAGPVWGSITLMVAVMVSLILAATVETVLGTQRRKLWLFVRIASLVAFAAVVLLGGGTISSMLYLESITMAAVVALWVVAYRRRLPGSGTLLTAIGLSGLAAAVRLVPLRFTLGWEWNADSIYHIAQVPGLVALYIGVRRLPPIPRRKRQPEAEPAAARTRQWALPNWRMASRIAALRRS